MKEPKSHAHRARTSTLNWPGLRTDYAWLPPKGPVTTTGAHQIGVAFTGHSGLVRSSAGRTVRTDTRPGAVYVTGSAPITWLEVHESTEAVEMYPTDDLLRSVAGGPVDVEPIMAGQDAVTFAISCLVRRAHVGKGHLTDIEASTLAHRLAHHVVTVYGRRRAPAPIRGCLDAQVVERIGEYVDAHLAGPITLDALAGVAHLSPFHFARAFKTTTGLTPHAFVTARRVETAKHRLLTSPATVFDAAAAVGYSNLGHFRRVFRRHVGVLPGDVQTQRRHKCARSDPPP